MVCWSLTASSWSQWTLSELNSMLVQHAVHVSTSMALLPLAGRWCKKIEEARYFLWAEGELFPTPAESVPPCSGEDAHDQPSPESEPWCQRHKKTGRAKTERTCSCVPVSQYTWYCVFRSTEPRSERKSWRWARRPGRTRFVGAVSDHCAGQAGRDIPFEVNDTYIYILNIYTITISNLSLALCWTADSTIELLLSSVLIIDKKHKIQPSQMCLWHSAGQQTPPSNCCSAVFSTWLRFK